MAPAESSIVSRTPCRIISRSASTGWNWNWKFIRSPFGIRPPPRAPPKEGVRGGRLRPKRRSERRQFGKGRAHPFPGAGVELAVVLDVVDDVVQPLVQLIGVLADRPRFRLPGKHDIPPDLGE